MSASTTDSSTQGELTRYPAGSFRELCRITLPLMLMTMSGCLMIFGDRLILSWYDLDVMGAAANAGMLAFTFLIFSMGVACIAEVFVGRFNGAGEKHRLGEPVWQMIWFTLIISILYTPIGIWGGHYLLPSSHHDHGIVYFQIIMGFGMCFALNSALSSFFVGRGKVTIVTIVTIFGNIFNLVLDYFLVFGWEGVVPSMGAKGAAIATIISVFLQVAVLFSVFLSSENRRERGTTAWRFRWQSFRECLQIGVPPALGHLIEVAAWTVLIQILTRTGPEHLAVFVIGQTIFIGFSFIVEGLQKGVIAVASNFIGARRHSVVSRIFRSALNLNAVMATLLLIPLVIYPEPLINLFISEENLSFIPLVKFSLFGVWCFFVFDGMSWALAGILTSGGDTRYVMAVNAVNAWFFTTIPAWFLIYKLNWSPGTAWMLGAAYAFSNVLFFYARYRSGRWKEIQISRNESPAIAS